MFWRNSLEVQLNSSFVWSVTKILVSNANYTRRQLPDIAQRKPIILHHEFRWIHTKNLIVIKKGSKGREFYIAI